MRFRKMLLACFFLVASVVLGALIAAGAANIPFLSWLAFGKSIGLSVSNPAVVDLSVIKVAFGFEVGITVAHILCFIGAFFAYLYLTRAMGLRPPKGGIIPLPEEDKNA